MNDKKKEILYTFACPLILGALCFILIYGTEILNPSYEDWLLAGGDLSQHYIGWEGFRSGSWTFPIGLSDRLTYPTSISVIFTDSIPLLAVFFKLLSPILPQTFQYWGLWGLMGFMLTALTSTCLIKKFSPHPTCTLLASLFFICSPTILQRLYGHESLGGGQWLVLASLIPLVYHEERYQETKRAAIFWGLLAFFCVGIHIYFSVICFFALIAFCLYDLLKTKKLLTSLAAGASYCLTSVIATWILGGLKGGIRGKGAGEVGEFSANINCLLNPLEYSRFFPALPVHGNGQHEGFAYLGLGIAVLLLLAFIFRFTGNQKGQAHDAPLAYDGKRLLAFLVAATLSFLFALSPLVTLGSQLLFTVPMPHAVSKLLVTFRSTGRIIWLCFYILYLAILWTFIKTRLKLPVKLAILAACLLLQLVDISPMMTARHRRHAGKSEYTNPFLQNSVMISTIDSQGIKHISIASSLHTEELYDVAQFAMKKGLTVNSFWTVHQIGRKDEAEILRKNLADMPPDTIFLFKKEDEGLGLEYGLDMHSVNEGYTLGIPKGQGK